MPAARLSRARPRVSCSRPDVVGVVHQVVREVLDQRLDREHRPVRAPARPGPLLAGDLPRWSRRSGPPATVQLVADLRGPLPPVLPFERGGVLVPVGEQRVLLGEHRAQPAVEHVADVAHVAAVLGDRPDLRRRPGGRVRTRPAERRTGPPRRRRSGAPSAAAVPPASKPQSGHGRRNVQVQSLSSGSGIGGFGHEPSIASARPGTDGDASSARAPGAPARGADR